ncbi:Gfo/Idh/MocA family oxidoreductase [Paramicrobacterium sp. CJ85]|uniref:Gfo/Idh/MocA family oxidoreductase n=1 Tax=Paramicrobacterium sp. CJ85 TaxID=3445355 RepID=UPI003F631D41
MTVKIGLVGFGTGGRWFHAPYIAASAECELVGIVTRSPERQRRAREEYPDTQICGSLAELVGLGADAVVITTPPETRRDLVLEAIALGLHVVADKPFAPDAPTGRLLTHEAERTGVLLNVFHNRRFDTDIVTALDVIAGGELGRLRRLELRCDQDDPASIDPGPKGGLLRDLGSHVVDQALLLLGEPVAVTAHLEWADIAEQRTNVGFTISIRHASGAFSHVSASKVYRLVSRELMLLGEAGSYRSDYSDVQTEAIVAGKRPNENRDTWGIESDERWGSLTTAAGVRHVPSLQGDYTRYYDEFARAITSGGAGPVPAEQGVTVLTVLDAAARSDREQITVVL